MSSDTRTSLWWLLPWAIGLVVVAAFVISTLKPWELLRRDSEPPTEPTSNYSAQLLVHNRCDLNYAVPGSVTTALARKIAIEATGDAAFAVTIWVMDGGVLKLAVMLEDGREFAGLWCWHRDGKPLDLLDVSPFDGSNLLFIDTRQQ